MGEFTLTGNTLLYVLVRCGGNYLYGMYTDIGDQSEENLRRAASMAQAELLQKNYADIDFDGNVAVGDDLCTAVQDCMDTEDVVTVEGKIRGKQKYLVIYRRIHRTQDVHTGAISEELKVPSPAKKVWGSEKGENKKFRVLEQGEEYRLSQKTVGELLTMLGVDKVKELPEEKAQKEIDFEISSALLQRKDAAGIRERVQDAQTADLVTDALTDQGNVVIVQQYGIGAAEDRWQAFVYGSAGALRVSLDYTAEDELVHFTGVGSGEIKAFFLEALNTHD